MKIICLLIFLGILNNKSLAQCSALKEQKNALLKAWLAANRNSFKDIERNYDHYNPLSNELERQIRECEKAEQEAKEKEKKNTASNQKIPNIKKSADLQNPAPQNLAFPGTSEQEREEKRQQASQNVNDLLSTSNQLFDNISQKNQDYIASQNDQTQKAVNDFNQQSDTKQKPKDEKGIMKDARSKSQSLDDLGPGMETDDEEENPAKKELENRIETLFDKEIGDQIGLKGKKVADKINKGKGYWDISGKFIDGTASPEDLKDLFHLSDNMLVKKFQEAGRDGAIGNGKAKIEALDQFSQNTDIYGIPTLNSEQMSAYENSMHPANYISPLKSVQGEKLTNFLKTNNPFNSENPDILKLAYAAGVSTIIGASTAPLWVPVVIGAWLAF